MPSTMTQNLTYFLQKLCQIEVKKVNTATETLTYISCNFVTTTQINKVFFGRTCSAYWLN